MLHQLLVLKVFGGKENSVVNNKFTCPQPGLWNTSESGWILLMKIKKTCWTICLSATGEFIRLDSFGCLLEFSCVLGKSNESHKWFQRDGNWHLEVTGGAQVVSTSATNNPERQEAELWGCIVTLPIGEHIYLMTFVCWRWWTESRMFCLK